jgi:hypothetical protein
MAAIAEARRRFHRGNEAYHSARRKWQVVGHDGFAPYYRSFAIAADDPKSSRHANVGQTLAVELETRLKAHAFDGVRCRELFNVR